MKVLPKSIVERRELNLRQGIKSSLSSIRSIIALVYTLYRGNNRKAVVEYSESTNGGQIKLHSTLENSIKTFLGIDDLTSINNNPLFKSQMEALQVGIELIFKLGKVEFIDSTLASSAERTGGNRYNKRIRFGTNIQIVDTFLSSYEADLSMFLRKWLQNQESEKREIDDGIKKLLTIFSEETQFKIRYNNQEVSFQQEGIYKEFANGNTVVGRDEHENVGPFRVFKSYVKEGLHPYISENGDEFIAKNATDDALEYYQIVSNALDLIPRRTQITSFVPSDPELEDNTIVETSNSTEVRQIIYYGAPGTGKSHIIKKQTEGESVVRTTFHPDSDYSTFVGCYKPITKEVEMRDVTGKVIIEHDQPVTENRIIYQFVEQAFLQAYIKAWKFYAEAEDGVDPKKQFLIIEEINRGNCAQIFGDLFQLLDRNDSGFSEYFIHADKDMQKHLSNAFKDYLIKDSHKDAINSLYPKEDEVVAKVLSGEILLLPNNLYIWATMNTSDQSLFPIDSAFKRRWDWEYEPIKYKNTNWVIDIEGSKYLWTSFQREINKRIFDATNSEDKMLGDYFVNPTDGVITEKILLNKILFYLWNDVCKDGEGDIFKTADNEEVTFSDLHSDGGKDKLIAMMEYLKVQEIVEDTDAKEPSKRKNPKYSINNSKDSYSTPETVCHVIQEYAEQNQGKSVQEMIDLWNGISERNDCLVDSWAPSPNDKQPFANKRRSEIKWGDKSVWVTRGWTEEIFQTFIRNAKEQLGVIIEKVE